MPAPIREKPWRGFPSINAVHGIRFQVNQATPVPPGDGVTPAINRALVSGKAVHIGTIPAGALILPVELHVKTLFDGTTPAFIIGDAADDDGILTAAASAVGTAGFKTGLATGAYIGVTDSELKLYAKLTAAGTTAGRLDVLIPFYINQD